MKMKYIVTVFSLIISSLCLHSTAHADEQPVTVVGAEFWSMPRHAMQVLELAPLKAAVQQLQREADASLVLHYPSSESGELWGLELQAWLVSLGITSDRIGLRAGYEGDDGVAVILVTPDAAEPPSVVPNEDENAVEKQSVQDEMESQ